MNPAAVKLFLDPTLARPGRRLARPRPADRPASSACRSGRWQLPLAVPLPAHRDTQLLRGGRSGPATRPRLAAHGIRRPRAGSARLTPTRRFASMSHPTRRPVIRNCADLLACAARGGTLRGSPAPSPGGSRCPNPTRRCPDCDADGLRPPPIPQDRRRDGRPRGARVSRASLRRRADADQPRRDRRQGPVRLAHAEQKRRSASTGTTRTRSAACCGRTSPTTGRSPRR